MAYIIFGVILIVSITIAVRSVYKIFTGKKTGCACSNASNCLLADSCNEKSK